MCDEHFQLIFEKRVTHFYQIFEGKKYLYSLTSIIVGFGERPVIELIQTRTEICH